MPRKIVPKLCACGCHEMTRGGEFIPGHDAKVYSAIIQHAGEISNLKRLVEKSTGKDININNGITANYSPYKLN